METDQVQKAILYHPEEALRADHLIPPGLHIVADHPTVADLQVMNPEAQVHQ